MWRCQILFILENYFDYGSNLLKLVILGLKIWSILGEKFLKKQML